MLDFFKANKGYCVLNEPALSPVPNKPSNVSVNGTSNNTHYLSISWVRPQDHNAELYEFRVSWAHDNNTSPIRNDSTNDTSYILNGLQPGKLYLVNLSSWIKGVPSAEVSEWALTGECDS